MQRPTLNLSTLMKLTFLGATKQVTGSMYLLTLENGYNILVDCGMDYETKRNPVYNPNLFPFNAADIDLVLLTHAHIDHSGNLPALHLNGFNGNILCTPATAALTEYLLLDSANIQLYEYKRALGSAKKNKRNLVPKPAYLDKHVAECMDRVVTVDFNKSFKVNEQIEVTFITAGHLLGAASIKVSVTENGHTTHVGFSGDLGRKNSKLVKDTEVFSGVDYLVTEGTYGGRKHQVSVSAEDDLLYYVNETCVKFRGRLIIPAFSVGRTQAIVFTLNQLKKKGLISPDLKVFVDSPLALKSTNVYSDYPDLMNEEAQDFFKNHGSLFEFSGIKYIDNQDETDDISYHYEPCIIVSAAGMVEGGRIQEHISNNIENPYATVLIAGFCAEGTLGHRLLQGQSSIRIKNRDKQVYAKIARTDIFSSHPDHDEIVDYIQQSDLKNSLKKIFLIHGEEPQLNAIQNALGSNIKGEIIIPDYADEYKL